MMHVALFEPEIPQNTGNIVRTCNATGAVLHLIEPLGFAIDNKKLKRAGLDCWHDMDIRYHKDFDTFLENVPGRTWFFSSYATKPYHEITYREGDCLVFGKETTGFPVWMREKYAAQFLRQPMLPGARCLNVSNSVAIALYEALRQQDFHGLG